MLDVLLAILLTLAVFVGVLFVLALLVGIIRLVKYGDARGPASAHDRDVAQAWRRVLEREVSVGFAPDVDYLDVRLHVPMKDATLLGVLSPRSTR